MENENDENYVPSAKISKIDSTVSNDDAEKTLNNNGTTENIDVSDDQMNEKSIGSTVCNDVEKTHNGTANVDEVSDIQTSEKSIRNLKTRKRPTLSTSDILSSITTKIQSRTTVTSKKYDHSIKELNKWEDIPNVEESSTNSSKGLSENDVGITEYISDYDGFNGVIKQRYSDFVVNEIGLDGHELKLTDFTIPADEVTTSDDLISPENMVKLESLQKAFEDKDDSLKEVKLEVSEIKEEREKLHYAIRAKFPNFVSNTLDLDGKKVFNVFVKTKNKKQERKTWPMNRGDYCHCLLYKEKKETIEAVGVVAKFLHVKPSLISFAGTKDRRGKTTQKISLHRIEAQKLLGFNKRNLDIMVGNFSYSNDVIKLGDLNGNAFNIVLRNVDGEDELINKSMTSLKESGFINYFGMQRFGTTAIPTHRIGKMMLQSKWDKVVDLILSFQEESISNAFAKQCMQSMRYTWSSTQDAKQALGKIPSNIRRIFSHTPEVCLLEGLIKSGPHDLIGALTHIPRSTRQMYLHAYQSYIWNTIVSKKIRHDGLKPQIGDLAYKSTGSNTKITEPILITEENISEFSIYDIILPLPGYDVTFPRNDTRNWISDLLDVDGLNINDFKNKIKDYCLPGDYRHIVAKPSDCTWDIVFYDDVTLPLIKSDKDKLNGIEFPDPSLNGKYKALVLKFNLPTSSYATMGLREVLKINTSAGHQTTLNVT